MKIKLASLLIGLIGLPFWLFLVYKILEHIQASELMWFVFWIYVPISIATGILSKVAEWEED